MYAFIKKEIYYFYITLIIYGNFAYTSTEKYKLQLAYKKNLPFNAYNAIITLYKCIFKINDGKIIK